MLSELFTVITSIDAEVNLSCFADNIRSEAARPAMGPRGRGAAMVAAAMRVSGTKGAPASTTAEAPHGGTDDEPVPLSPPIAGVEQLPSWRQLAREQVDVTDDVLEASMTGDFFALEDRNLMSAPWRRVFVIRDGDDFVLLDTCGRLIVEKEDGVPDGRQSASQLVQEFHRDGMYYRPPKIRRTPASERRHTRRLEDDDATVPFRCPARKRLE